MTAKVMSVPVLLFFPSLGLWPPNPVKTVNNLRTNGINLSKNC